MRLDSTGTVNSSSCTDICIELICRTTMTIATCIECTIGMVGSTAERLHPVLLIRRRCIMTGGATRMDTRDC